MKFKEYIDAENMLNEMIAMSESTSLGTDYALGILDKLEKVSAYLIKTKLKNPGDLDRFKKFLDMVEKELPNLSKSIEEITKKITYLPDNHVLNYYK